MCPLPCLVFSFYLSGLLHHTRRGTHFVCPFSPPHTFSIKNIMRSIDTIFFFLSETKSRESRFTRPAE